MFHRTNRAAMLGAPSAAAIAMSLAATAVPAFAQDEPLVDDRVVVTGSRIARRDFQANSPIVTVESTAFESQTGLNIEAYLNRLPQFNPAASPVTTEQDVQVTAVNSVGIATVSLRGLGANRNLVLVDGRRPTPVNALGVTDINAIPSALIERTEIITGGASAVYGADAVGGVVNFILRDNFDGLEIDTQYGFNEVGDGEEFRISAVAGTNFANGRGNVTVGVEHYSRSAAYENKRDWQREEWADPTLASGDLFVAGMHGFVSEGANAVDRAVADSLFPNRPPGTSVCAASGCGGFFAPTFSFNPDGTVWHNPGTNTGLAGLGKYRGEPVDGLEFAYQNIYNTGAGAPGSPPTPAQALKWNNTDAFISAPQTRYSFFGSINYDLTDSIEFFARTTFAESDTRTRLIPSPAIGGWEARIPYNPTTDSPILGTDLNSVNPNFIPSSAPGAQHPVTPELAALLNSRAGGTVLYCLTGTCAPGTPAAAQTTDTALVGTPAPVGVYAPWQLNFIPDDWFSDRSTINTITNWQVEAGLRGELPFRDWTWDIYISHAESETYNLADGNFSLERYRALVTAPDYGRNARISGNQASVRPGFGIDPGVCTSGFYDTIFGGDQAPSADCIYEVAAPLQTRTQVQQDIAELNLQGGLFELPAGEIRGAFGVQYRELAAQFYPDQLQSTRSFLDQVIGVYPAAYMDASTYVTDTYGELLVPVLSDLPFVQQLDLELGARYSDYEQTGTEWTYKILGDWTVTDWLRFRGGYNRATRAPNLGELFLGRQILFTAETAFSDPCGLRSSAPYGAGGAGTDPVVTGNEDPSGATPLASGQTLAGAQSTRLICEAQMGAAAANTYYNIANAAGGPTVPAFFWVYQEGNPDLDSEKADTWTAGLVLQSPFDNPWLAGLSASIDWYKLDIEDAIQQYSVNYARALCYGSVIVSTPAEAAARAASPECQAVPRTGGTIPGFAGAADTIQIRYDNQATIETSGVDVAVNWSAQFEDLGLGLPGGVGVNTQFSWLDYYRTKASPFGFDPVIDWKGSLGPTLSGTNPGAYNYRLFTSFSYFLDELSVSLRWRHLPSVWSAGYAAQQAIIENNRAVQAGAEGTILTFTPTTEIKTDSYDVFDLSFNWNITEVFSLRGGVNNLFDKDPPRSGASEGYPVGADLAGVCEAAGFPGTTATTGCQNPNNFSLPNGGTANSAYYDVTGRSFFMGLKARF